MILAAVASAALVSIGIVALVLSSGGRQPPTESGTDEFGNPLPVQNSTHWHAVYGVWDCNAGTNGAYLVPFASSNDLVGIHSHQDGLMHIHPYFDASDGPDAQIGLFFEAMGAQLDDVGLTLPADMDNRRLANGDDCADEAAELHVRKWDSVARAQSSDPQVFTSDLSAIRYLNDGEVYVIAFAPLDADIPLPPAERFAGLDGAAGPITSTGPFTANG